MSGLNNAAEKHCKAIAGILKNARLAQEMSVNRLSELSGVTRGMISFIEKGNRTPTVRTLFLLATGLGITSSEIIAAAEAESDIAKIKRNPKVAGRKAVF